MTTPFRGAALLFLALLAGPVGGPQPASAQDGGLVYTVESSIELGGTFGAVTELLAGDATRQRESVYLKGGRMRTDAEDHSTILDLDEGRMIQVDHEARRFSVLELASLGDAVEGAGAALAELEEGGMRIEARDEAAPEADRAHLEVRVSSDATGERSTVAGLDAERIFVTVEIEGSATDTTTGETRAESLVFLTELWQADEVPEMRAFAARGREAARAVAPEMGQDFGRAMERVYSADPRVRVALDEGTRRAAELGGFTVRSSTFLVTVPDGVAFDRERALQMKEVSLADEAKSAAADAAAESARDAAREAVGGLGGLFGGGDEEEEEEETPEPAQTTLIKVVTEVTDLSRSGVSDDLFAPPEEYEATNPPGG